MTVAIFPWGDPVERFLDPIGLTLTDFAESMSGGWLFGYVAALASAGRRAAVVCPSRTVARTTRLLHAETGAEIWAVPSRYRAGSPSRGRSAEPLRAWLTSPWRGYARALREIGCEAVLAQEYEDPRFDGLARLGAALGVPVYATFQGGDRTLSTLEDKVRASSLRRAAGLIVPSARERERLVVRYGAALPPVHAVPNPLDAEAWRPASRGAARRALGWPADAFVVAWHGRVDVARKGLDVLLDGWRRFAAGRADARLVMVGSGQDDAAFERLVSDLGDPRVDWVRGYDTDRALMRRRLSAADVYVTASRVEGMPVAPLEAMACGLPVVSSDAHGLPDVFADGEASGGVVVPREAPAALAAALTRLADDPELRATLGQAARRRVEATYRSEAVGRALDAVLRPAPESRPHGWRARRRSSQRGSGSVHQNGFST